MRNDDHVECRDRRMMIDGRCEFGGCLGYHGKETQKKGSNFSAETIFTPFLQRLLIKILRT